MLLLKIIKLFRQGIKYRVENVGFKCNAWKLENTKQYMYQHSAMRVLIPKGMK